MDREQSLGGPEEHLERPWYKGESEGPRRTLLPTALLGPTHLLHINLEIVKNKQVFVELHK